MKSIKVLIVQEEVVNHSHEVIDVRELNEEVMRIGEFLNRVFHELSK